MRKWLLTSSALAALLQPVAALAGETIAYTYDAAGRLTVVSRSGTVNNGVQSSYSYDRVDNRVGMSTSGSSGTVPANPYSAAMAVAPAEMDSPSMSDPDSVSSSEPASDSSSVEAAPPDSAGATSVSGPNADPVISSSENSGTATQSAEVAPTESSPVESAADAASAPESSSQPVPAEAVPEPSP